LNEVTEAIIARAKKIKVVIFDVDGVMTDGGLMIGDDGQEYKVFHAHDGLGMKLLNKTDVKMAIITGRTSNVVRVRAETNHIEHCYQGVEDKGAAFDDLVNQLGISPEEAAFMGDDIVDIPPMRKCGLAITVPTAQSPVKEYAHYVTTNQAGKGAVREVCELIMKAQDTFDTITSKYFK
jgi:3-deoxy-D-manno-octulosonate 8-phosphate phosphatase (KDO 8-P phosphatase)